VPVLCCELFLAFLCAFPVCRHNAPSSRNGKEHLAGTKNIAESKQSNELEPILAQTTVAHFPVMPLALDYLEWMLHERAHPRCLVVALTLR